MSSLDSSKQFDSIHDDYTFFEEHASEAEGDLQGYLPCVSPLAQSGQVVRLLDFGCGDGRFSVRFLSGAGFLPDKLTISLVEPDAGYRQQAATLTQAFTATPVSAWPALPAGREDSFDLVLANHVFYYVNELSETLGQILHSLTAGGLFLMSMAGSDNVLMKLIEASFSSLHQPMPYHRAEDVEATLAQLGQSFKKQEVHYQLIFPDLKENRLKILRFLLGDHFAQMEQRQILKLFDAYTREGRVVIQTFHYQYVIGK
ncbi:MAG: methyltransferase domain-containing protein [Thermodesulfobacteriota bacterium]